MSVLDSFEIEFDAFLQENEHILSELLEKVGDHGDVLDDLFWENIDELKGYLAGLAANDAGDDPERQEEAIAEAEEWVSENMSNSDLKTDLALMLWLRGFEEGPKLISEQLVGV